VKIEAGIGKGARTDAQALQPHTLEMGCGGASSSDANRVLRSARVGGAGVSRAVAPLKSALCGIQRRIAVKADEDLRLGEDRGAIVDSKATMLQ
jgi:hypothetical protein